MTEHTKASLENKQGVYSVHSEKNLFCLFSKKKYSDLLCIGVYRVCWGVFKSYSEKNTQRPLFKIAAKDSFFLCTGLCMTESEIQRPLFRKNAFNSKKKAFF